MLQYRRRNSIEKPKQPFLEQYQIPKSSLESIFQSLEADGFKVKVLF